jgi:hypothetical protein
MPLVPSYQATLRHAKDVFTCYTNAHGYDLPANRLDLARADAEIVLRDFQSDPAQYPEFAEALASLFQQFEQIIDQAEQLLQSRRATYEAWRAQMCSAHIEEARTLENALGLLLESSDAGMNAWQGLRNALLVAERAVYERVYQPDLCNAWEEESAILRLRDQIERAHSAYTAIQAERTTPPPAQPSAATAHPETTY